MSTQRLDPLNSHDRHDAMLQLKVALLTSFIPPYRVPHFRALAKRLKDLRIFVSVQMEPNRNWAVQWEGLQVVKQKNFTLHRTWRHPEGFSDQLFVQVPYDTVFRLSSYRPDVVITDELGMRTLQTVLYRALRPRTGIVAWVRVSEHTEQGRGALRRRLRRWLAPRLDAVFVHGKSGAKYLRCHGVPDESLFCVDQAVDVSGFLADLSKAAPRTPRRLLYVGQLSARKGLLSFLQALDRWARAHPQRKLEFWLAGDGPIRSDIAAFSLPENVQLKLLGSIQYKDLPKVYGDADILVFPTLADVWGLVVNEAMAAGLPVLGSLYSQAVEELVEDGVTGWVFYPDREKFIYDALERALSVPAEEFVRMRQQSQWRIKCVTIDSMTDEMLSAIRYAYDKRQSRRVYRRPATGSGRYDG